MIEPKEFYRKLDSLLSKINMAESGADFLFTIVKELEKTFGTELHIGKGRVYEKNGDEYLLLSRPFEQESTEVETRLSVNSDAIQAILNSQTFIFDNHESGIILTGLRNKEYAIPVAILVHNNEQNWILIFELKSGWVREEIEFCLNAVRAVLIYRLLSESYKNEYEQAFLVQKSLLPISSPRINGYQISGNSQQSELVGGDVFDYYKFNDDEFGFCIGDASGHGMPAALMARDVIIGLRMGLENQHKMAHTLKKLNRVIFQSANAARFISLFYAEIETNGALFYINAGHPPPILISGDDVTELKTTGLIFGVFPEIDLRRSYVEMYPGNILILYTDGIIERQNNLGEEFGRERLIDVILKNKTMDTEEILNAIFNDANKFGNKRKWRDDATVVVIKRIE
ncbi:MAG TPA: PP2C family protein-serine/threonine phosphatase [Ignavibacteriaceae bacterium]|nr:PP2C family protein-serine/threonine phosphatase [Ignavibacteriaceae bacterium]